MKTTTVPAQVTTIEDKIAGNLSLTQLILLAAPVFIGAALYAVMPPNFQYALYKVAVLLLLIICFGSLAIRIRGMLIIQWVVIFFHYNMRPRYSLYDKNNPYLRTEIPKLLPKPVAAVEAEKSPKHMLPLVELATAERVKFEEIMRNPNAKLMFRTNKKGALNVTISEVE
jgi:PrgI family protein